LEHAAGVERPQTSRLHYLDGLRGWGAVVVLLYHLFCNGFPITPDIGKSLSQLLPLSGLFAVAIFFVVSGISLSIGYLRKGDDRNLLGIAAGRHLRLAIPILFLSLALHLIIAAGYLSPASERLPKFADAFSFGSTVGYAVKFSLFDVFFNYSFERSYAGPLWTMTYELIGSYLLVAALLLFSRARLQTAGLLLVGVLLVCFQDYRWYSLFFFGSVSAVWLKNGWGERVPSWAGVATIAICATAPLFYSPWSMQFALAAAAFTLACTTVPTIRRFLSTPLSTWLGAISFPLYLTHGSVMVFVGEPVMRHFGQTMAMNLLINAGLVALSIGVAIIAVPVNEMSIKASRAFGARVVSAALWRHRISQA